MDSPRPVIHPLFVRVTHWVNAAAVMLMLMSGWRIYNAAPLFGFRFPDGITLGGWLAGALQWHFAAMWLFGLNLAAYVAYGIFSGHFRGRFFPLTPKDVARDTRAFFAGTLGHADPRLYNGEQKLAYLGVLAALAVLIASGIALWKPVQFQDLAALMGGYEGARRVHFFAMLAVVAFLIVHIVMALSAPRALLSMLRGRR